jgi:hypothetical protein
MSGTIFAARLIIKNNVFIIESEMGVYNPPSFIQNGENEHTQDLSS